MGRILPTPIPIKQKTCVVCNVECVIFEMVRILDHWYCRECRRTRATAEPKGPFRDPADWVPPDDYPPQFIGKTWGMVAQEGMIRSHYPSLQLGEEEADDFFEMRAYRTEYYGRPENKDLDRYCVRCEKWYVSRPGLVCGHCRRRDEEQAGTFHRRLTEGEKKKAPSKKKAATAPKREPMRTTIKGVRR